MAQELYIYRKVDNVETKVIETPITDFTVSVEFMGDNKLDLEFSHHEQINFELNEYVEYEYEGDNNSKETYYLIEPPQWEKNEKSLMLSYKATFVAASHILMNIPMTDTFIAVDDVYQAAKPTLYQTEYSFFSETPFRYFINIVSSVIAEMGTDRAIGGVNQPTGWTFNYYDDPADGFGSTKPDGEIITISNQSVFAALKDLHEQFGIPFKIKGRTVHVGYKKTVIDHVFRYGKGKGLYKISKAKRNDSIITKIRGVGSDRNVPYEYMQTERELDPQLAGVPMSHLMPKIFRDSLNARQTDPNAPIVDYYVCDNFNPEFPLVSFEKLDEIYPTIAGVEHLGEPIDVIKGVYFMADDANEENKMEIEDGSDSKKVVNPTFWIKIPKLGFDLSKSLSEKGQLILSPVSGQAGGCMFNVISIGNNGNQWIGSDDRRIVRTAVSLDGFDISASQNASEFTFEIEREIAYGDKIDFAPKGYIDHNRTTHMNSIGARFDYSVSYEIYNEANTSIKTIVGVSGSITTGTGKKRIEINPPTSDFTFVSPTGFSGVGKFRFVIRASVSSTQTGATNRTEKGTITINMNPLDMPLTKPNVSYPSANDTSDESQWLLVQKDLESYNMLMPYVVGDIGQRVATTDIWNPLGTHPQGLVPAINDKYVFLGINLPQQYILSAEERLENALIDLLEDNCHYKYDYSCSFDEKMLFTNPEINNQIRVGNIMEISDETNPALGAGQTQDVVIHNLTLRYKGDKQFGSVNS